MNQIKKEEVVKIIKFIKTLTIKEQINFSLLIENKAKKYKEKNNKN